MNMTRPYPMEPQQRHDLEALASFIRDEIAQIPGLRGVVAVRDLDHASSAVRLSLLQSSADTDLVATRAQWERVKEGLLKDRQGLENLDGLEDFDRF